MAGETNTSNRNIGESNWKGISIRAILALVTVGSGLAFLYVMAFAAIFFLNGDLAVQIGLSIVVAVISFINLALGFYLGQKGVAEAGSPEVEVITEGAEVTTGPNGTTVTTEKEENDTT